MDDGQKQVRFVMTKAIGDQIADVFFPLIIFFSQIRNVCPKV